MKIKKNEVLLSLAEAISLKGKKTMISGAASGIGKAISWRFAESGSDLLLVEKDDEPITTFIDKVESLYFDKGISTILVLGGIGDYFDVSNIVIQMKNYVPVDVTVKAHEISCSTTEKRLYESGYFTGFRGLELTFAINRLRELKIE